LAPIVQIAGRIFSLDALLHFRTQFGKMSSTVAGGTQTSTKEGSTSETLRQVISMRLFGEMQMHLLVLVSIKRQPFLQEDT
jgi:hypothetical protein